MTHSPDKENTSLFGDETPTVWDALRDLPEADDYEELLERDCPGGCSPRPR